MGCKKQMGFYEILTSRTKNSREETDDVNLTERVRGMPVHTDTEQKPHTRLPPSSPACRPQAPPAALKPRLPRCQFLQEALPSGPGLSRRLPACLLHRSPPHVVCN